MMQTAPGTIITSGLMLMVMACLLSACSEDVFIGGERENQPPTVRLTNAPPEGLTTVYQVHFYWLGHDPDGRIDHYEYTVADGDPIGFDPADTTGLDKWTGTTLTDIEFEVSADEMLGQQADIVGAFERKIMPDTGGDKDVRFFLPGILPFQDAVKHFDDGVVARQLGTRRWIQTAHAFAGGCLGAGHGRSHRLLSQG